MFGSNIQGLFLVITHDEWIRETPETLKPSNIRIDTRVLEFRNALDDDRMARVDDLGCIPESQRPKEKRKIGTMDNGPSHVFEDSIAAFSDTIFLLGIRFFYYLGVRPSVIIHSLSSRLPDLSGLYQSYTLAMPLNPTTTSLN